ncbi:MAG TPA: class F sortase [Mycobacteriales bacterium]|nr:class F sortase [Mycobacteriales bacterium]
MNRSRIAGGAVAVFGAGCIAAAFLSYDHRGYHTPKDAGVVPAAAAPHAAASEPAHPAVVHTYAPVKVGITDIKVTAPVVPVAVHKGSLDVPGDVHTLGWWAKGAKPGDARGSVVIVGHVDAIGQGQGALFHLESVKVGSLIHVTTAHKTVVTYKVVGRRVYDKQVLPASVFSQKIEPRLVLITCGGPYDAATYHYRDNVVVYAVPV